MLPLLYAIWTAFHPGEYAARFDLLAPLTLDNFAEAWIAAPFARYFLNSRTPTDEELAAAVEQTAASSGDTATSVDAAELDFQGAFQGPLGLQLWSVREQMAQDVPGTLAWVREQGFTEVELAGTQGMTPEAFRQELDRAGLRLIRHGGSRQALANRGRGPRRDGRSADGLRLRCHVALRQDDAPER